MGIRITKVRAYTRNGRPVRGYTAKRAAGLGRPRFKSGLGRVGRSNLPASSDRLVRLNSRPTPLSRGNKLQIAGKRRRKRVGLTGRANKGATSDRQRDRDRANKRISGANLRMNRKLSVAKPASSGIKPKTVGKAAVAKPGAKRKRVKQTMVSSPVKAARPMPLSNPMAEDVHASASLRQARYLLDQQVPRARATRKPGTPIPGTRYDVKPPSKTGTKKARKPKTAEQKAATQARRRARRAAAKK